MDYTMNNSDIVNGVIELIAACFALLNIKQLYKDKKVRGVSPLPTFFFTAWGIWNIVFYPMNGLWFSFYGGAALATVNIFYFSLMWFYITIEKRYGTKTIQLSEQPIDSNINII